jgi:DNA-binding Lrp family transcriptional regulator
VDRTDTAILAALQENARISYKELGALTGLAPSTCLERVRQLQRRGVIRAFRTTVDLERIGRGLQALIAIRFRQHSRRLAAPFADYVLGLPETLALFNVTGPDDYLLHVAVPDTRHLRAFVLDRLGDREEIAYLRTSLIFEHQSKAAITPITSHQGGGADGAGRAAETSPPAQAAGQLASPAGRRGPGRDPHAGRSAGAASG